jgi:hypothetical protein
MHMTALLLDKKFFPRRTLTYNYCEADDRDRDSKACSTESVVMFIPSLCQILHRLAWLIYERRDKGFHQPQLGSSFWIVWV